MGLLANYKLLTAIIIRYSLLLVFFKSFFVVRNGYHHNSKSIGATSSEMAGHKLIGFNVLNIPLIDI